MNGCMYLFQSVCFVLLHNTLNSLPILSLSPSLFPFFSFLPLPPTSLLSRPRSCPSPRSLSLPLPGPLPPPLPRPLNVSTPCHPTPPPPSPFSHYNQARSQRSSETTWKLTANTAAENGPDNAHDAATDLITAAVPGRASPSCPSDARNRSSPLSILRETGDRSFGA